MSENYYDPAHPLDRDEDIKHPLDHLYRPTPSTPNATNDEDDPRESETSIVLDDDSEDQDARVR